MHHPTDRITHTTAFVTPVVEHWLEREITQWVHPMKDRSDDPSHHERTLYLWATSRSWYREYYTSTRWRRFILQWVVSKTYLTSESIRCINIPAAFHGNTRQVPWLHSCLYRWFTGWKCCGLCYSFSIKHRNLHEIAWLSIRIHCWSLGNH